MKRFHALKRSNSAYDAPKTASRGPINSLHLRAFKFQSSADPSNIAKDLKKKKLPTIEEMNALKADLPQEYRFVKNNAEKMLSHSNDHKIEDSILLKVLLPLSSKYKDEEFFLDRIIPGTPDNLFLGVRNNDENQRTNHELIPNEEEDTGSMNDDDSTHEFRSYLPENGNQRPLTKFNPINTVHRTPYSANTSPSKRGRIPLPPNSRLTGKSNTTSTTSPDYDENSTYIPNQSNETDLIDKNIIIKPEDEQSIIEYQNEEFYADEEDNKSLYDFKDQGVQSNQNNKESESNSVTTKKENSQNSGIMLKEKEDKKIIDNKSQNPETNTKDLRELQTEPFEVELTQQNDEEQDHEESKQPNSQKKKQEEENCENKIEKSEAKNKNTNFDQGSINDSNEFAPNEHPKKINKAIKDSTPIQSRNEDNNNEGINTKKSSDKKDDENSNKAKGNAKNQNETSNDHESGSKSENQSNHDKIYSKGEPNYDVERNDQTSDVLKKINKDEGVMDDIQSNINLSKNLAKKHESTDKEDKNEQEMSISANPQSSEIKNITNFNNDENIPIEEPINLKKLKRTKLEESENEIQELMEDEPNSKQESKSKNDREIDKSNVLDNNEQNNLDNYSAVSNEYKHSIENDNIEERGVNLKPLDDKNEILLNGAITNEDKKLNKAQKHLENDQRLQRSVDNEQKIYDNDTLTLPIENVDDNEEERISRNLKSDDTIQQKSPKEDKMKDGDISKTQESSEPTENYKESTNKNYLDNLDVTERVSSSPKASNKDSKMTERPKLVGNEQKIIQSKDEIGRAHV